MDLEYRVSGLKEKYEKTIEEIEILDSYIANANLNRLNRFIVEPLPIKRSIEKTKELHKRLENELNELSSEYKKLMNEYGLKPKEDPIEQVEDLDAILLGIKGKDTSNFWKAYDDFAKIAGENVEYTFDMINRKLAQYTWRIVQLKVQYILDHKRIGGENIDNNEMIEYIIEEIDELKEDIDLIKSVTNIISEYNKIMDFEAPEKLEEIKRDIEIIDKFRRIK